MICLIWGPWFRIFTVKLSGWWYTGLSSYIHVFISLDYLSTCLYYLDYSSYIFWLLLCNLINSVYILQTRTFNKPIYLFGWFRNLGNMGAGFVIQLAPPSRPCFYWTISTHNNLHYYYYYYTGLRLKVRTHCATFCATFPATCIAAACVNSATCWAQCCRLK